MGDKCQAGDISYLPTALDWTHASMYAYDKILKEKCSHPSVLKTYPDVKWRPRDDLRMYPCPDGLTCEHGNAVIGTKEMCLNLSQAPFDKNTGQTLEGIACKTTADCKNSPFSASCYNNKCSPKFPYLEWRDDPTKPNGGQCIFGNFPYYMWCEFPHLRRTSSERGVTDVPPFIYDNTKGKCLLTKPYCDWMGINYEIDNGEPNCKPSEFQKIMEEFFVGKTIFRKLKKTFDGFKPPTTMKLIVDINEMKSYTKFGNDFGGTGIHLYQIEFKNGQKRLGYISTEIKNVYPYLIMKENGIDYLMINEEQVKFKPELKRLFLMGNLGENFYGEFELELKRFRKKLREKKERRRR